MPLLIAALAALGAVVLGWSVPGQQADNALQDFLLRLNPSPSGASHSIILAFDDRTLMEEGGVRGLRRTLARALDLLNPARPAVVAIDLTLADAGDAAEDARLAQAFGATRNLVLATEMLRDGSAWQEPIPPFAMHAAALGHVNALPDPYDKINRAIALERVAGRSQRWALALEAFRVWKGAPPVRSSPTDIAVAGVTIESRWDAGRPLRVWYRPDGSLPQVGVSALLRDPSLAAKFAHKVVFVGVTAQSAVVDRLQTPVSLDMPMPGVEIHAQAFETIAGGRFLNDVSLAVPVLLAFGFALAIGAAFRWLPSRWPYLLALAALAVAHLLPAVAFPRGLVLPGFAPAVSAWLAALGCGTWQFFAVRRQLRKSEAERQRYQQAFHFVAHEMRTPLTAIQGSSELISRYNLPDEKRKELSQMINAESKRLARMITTFLDVERLNSGQMELRRAPLDLEPLVAGCVDRARPLADRKQIRVSLETLPDGPLEADRELLEYAVYNLVTNAIKYSPPNTEVRVTGAAGGGEISLSVRDQGIGMDEKEVKQIFQRFYRTRKAVASGETGTGIGLSIVEQIVTQHGGRIEVESKPDQGSCFTIVLPSAAAPR